MKKIFVAILCCLTRRRKPMAGAAEAHRLSIRLSVSPPCSYGRAEPPNGGDRSGRFAHPHRLPSPERKRHGVGSHRRPWRSLRRPGEQPRRTASGRLVHLPGRDRLRTEIPAGSKVSLSYSARGRAARGSLGAVSARAMGFSPTESDLLASLPAVTWQRPPAHSTMQANRKPVDPLDRLSSRPDFLVLGYPWLNAMQPSGHHITYCSMIKTIPPETCKVDEQKYTPSLHVTPQTPTTFIYSTTDDQTVPISASVDFYNALIAAGVPAELHIFRHGSHGAAWERIARRSICGPCCWNSGCAIKGSSPRPQIVKFRQATLFGTPFLMPSSTSLRAEIELKPTS